MPPVHVKPSNYTAVFEAFEGPAMRPEAAPSRIEALLLRDAYEKMEENVRNKLGGEDPNVLARQAAAMGQSERVMNLMEPEFYVMDVTLTELVKQVRVGCTERGEVLEKCRARFMELFMTTSLALQKMGEVVEIEKRTSKELKDEFQSLEEQVAQGILREQAHEQEILALRADCERLKRAVDDHVGNEETRQEVKIFSKEQREKMLMDQIKESDEITGVLFGKTQVRSPI